MENRSKHLQDLQEIRNLMERSSRFISLSGLSGIVAGIFALIGGSLVFLYLDLMPFAAKKYYYVESFRISKWGFSVYQFLALDAVIVLIAALAAGIFFTTRKAKEKGQRIWDKLTQRLLVELSIPLIAGGIFCLALIHYRMLGLVAPATIIFYGLGLVNASKYTLSDIRYLGISEIILGLIALFWPGYGLELWMIGFGVLHILYGGVMYFRHD